MALPLVSTAIIAFQSFFLITIPYIVFTVLKVLGLGYVSYVGFDLLFGAILDNLFSSYNSLPADLLMILDLFGLHKALNMLASTVSVIVTYKVAEMAMSGKFKRTGGSMTA